MDGADYFYVFVEAGVAISGFSALVIALRVREPVDLSEIERRIVVRLVERGLMAAFLSLPYTRVNGVSVLKRLAHREVCYDSIHPNYIDVCPFDGPGEGCPD